jgi:hypothetical protein
MKVGKLSAICGLVMLLALMVGLVIVHSSGGNSVQRIAEVNQTVTTRYDDSLNIERVIATRQDVRVVWRLDKPQNHGPGPAVPAPANELYACCSLKLVVGAKSVDISRARYYISPHRENIVAGSLLDEQGDWLISASYYSTWTGNMYYPDQPGPQFHFAMPPAINSAQP